MAIEQTAKECEDEIVNMCLALILLFPVPSAQSAGAEVLGQS